MAITIPDVTTNDAQAAPAATIPALLTKAMIRRFYVPAGIRTIERWISAGEFPAADISMGAKIRYWKRETVERWIESRAV